MTPEVEDPIEPPISILKTVWSQTKNDQWAMTGMKGIELRPRDGFESDYFAIESQFELMTNQPSGNWHELVASVGPTDFLLKRSIVPVVAWCDGETLIRTVGTGSIISCTGYVLTAAHVLMDPYESGYGKGTRIGNQITYGEDFHFGVLLPTGPLSGVRGHIFFPFERYWTWGDFQASPLIHQPEQFHYLTDLAICKIPQLPDKAAHQPLNLSLNRFAPGEAAYAIGYAEMEDIPVRYSERGMSLPEFNMELYVSIGKVMTVFPKNHEERSVPTPGPCFDFQARIPGKMSGSPVFGAQGAIIRGVVSRSFSGERHSYGAMLGPAMGLPINEPGVDGRSLRSLQLSGSEGITIVHGQGL